MFLCLKYLIQFSKWWVELGVWTVVFFPFPEESVYSFLVYFGIVQVWPMYQSLDKKVWFTIIFLHLKESLILLQIWIFYYTFTYFVPFGVIENRVTKVKSKYFSDCDHFICSDQFYFYMHQHIRLDFLKSFYLRFMHIYIVLKWLVSY